MLYNDLIDLVEQLEREDKELIAITDSYILVYWYEHKSYVSWKYWHTGPNGKYVFEHGDYLPIGSDGSVSKNEAINKFAKRIN